MRFSSPSLALVVALPALVAAHHEHIVGRHPGHPIEARQATTPSPSSSGSVVGTGTTAAPTPSTTISVSLASTNPTAVPLTAIVSNQPSSATKPLDSTAVPGSTPTFISGAPPLPNPATLAPASYPTLDRLPPIDSPEVQEWIQEVKNTGIVIPDLEPTVAGGCPANAAFAADQSRCWWTCGGCVRDTDITDCPTAMDWGLTYDDGPSFYTSNLLSYLDEQNLKSTFFVVGSRVISFPAILQTQYMGQHQIAVHTWSHPSLTTLTNEEIIAELGWSRKVIKDVLGVTPNMMRPPYGDIDDRVRAISLAMGLIPVMWTRISPLATFDTDDFNIHGGSTTVEQVLLNWKNILGNVSTLDHGFIVLEHDLFEQTVEVATGYILPDALAHNPPFKIQPVVSCLNKGLSEAYIETNNNSTNPPALAAAISAGVVTTTSVSPSSTGSGGTGNAGTGGALGLASPSLAFMISLVGLVVGAYAV
ncbi:unnamed protein product [Cyclocybe aegerita]|uniref:chitin deacetylase n=1 Tax=Cyclocybe aegerita TaxID=1973307 RepID=A0A8S0WUL0_CYCAE|nr:unnamed protein product [Cyclocybe aegerita]